MPLHSRQFGHYWLIYVDIVFSTDLDVWLSLAIPQQVGSFGCMQESNLLCFAKIFAMPQESRATRRDYGNPSRLSFLFQRLQSTCRVRDRNIRKYDTTWKSDACTPPWTSAGAAHGGSESFAGGAWRSGRHCLTKRRGHCGEMWRDILR